ncbi:excalibur calcium-binding domain-containing protein [Candidatus Palauibacter sp.]|uniref:excalibur calcium-binding domain-containing protein n=1 Tax=Candidatus Palauibacter sp. TaxID=3101350 RepID=UPI003AF295A2
MVAPTNPGDTGARPVNDWKSNLPWFLAGASSAALVTVLLTTTGPAPQSVPVPVEDVPRITNPVAPPGDLTISPPAETRPPPVTTPGSALALYDDNGNGRISCAEARAHGIAPVSRDHPAYQYMRDGDGDGVVCE